MRDSTPCFPSGDIEVQKVAAFGIVGKRSQTASNKQHKWLSLVTLLLTFDESQLSIWWHFRSSLRS